MKLPFFKFDVMSWLTGNIRFLEPEEQGIFITLCALIWRDGGEYKVDDFTHRQLNASQQVLNKCLQVYTSAGIMLNTDGILTVKFIDEQLVQNKEIREKRAEAGRISAAKRASFQQVSTNKKEERRKKKEECREKINTTAKADIDRIYQSYPRKQGKATALKAIEKALKKVEYGLLIEAVCQYADAVNGQDVQFIPHPATWFNQERYNDDRSTWSAWKNSDLFGKPQDHQEGSFANHIDTREDF